VRVIVKITDLDYLSSIDKWNITSSCDALL